MVEDNNFDADAFIMEKYWYSWLRTLELYGLSEEECKDACRKSISCFVLYWEKEPFMNFTSSHSTNCLSYGTEEDFDLAKSRNGSEIIEDTRVGVTKKIFHKFAKGKIQSVSTLENCLIQLQYTF